MRESYLLSKSGRLLVLIVAFLLLYSELPVSAQTLKTPPPIQGEAVCLMDLQSGQVLYAKNADEKLNPASTTKIMTALLAIERGNLNDIVTASRTMLDSKIVYGTQIYLRPGESMPLKDLLYAVLLNSANDAAVAVAEYIGGDLPHFVHLMNEKAKEIGMDNTHFMNPTGLTEKGHFTTARDLALLAKVAYQNPIFRDYIKTKTYTIARTRVNVPTTMVNENKLLWLDPDVNGMKTGYTTAAENCLVATAARNGRQLVGVILKAPGGQLFSNMEALLNWGFLSAPVSNKEQGAPAITNIAKPEVPKPRPVQQGDGLKGTDALRGMDLGVIDFLYFSPWGVLLLLIFYLLVLSSVGIASHRRLRAKRGRWEED